MGSDTTAFLIVIAVFVIVVLAGIWWGVVLRRRRARAERAVAAHRDAVAHTGSATAAPPSPPVDPSPRPIADEPIAAAAPLEASPASMAADVPPAPSPAPALAADLTQLKGLGPKLANTLAELGFTRIEQIAALTPAEAEALDARLGNFRGRITRDRWVEQARLLAAGDRAGYEAEFGKLGG
jgi:predicted flap endonuclease-1-like 5' DNA nuclease